MHDINIMRMPKKLIKSIPQRYIIQKDDNFTYLDLCFYESYAYQDILKDDRLIHAFAVRINQVAIITIDDKLAIPILPSSYSVVMKKIGSYEAVEIHCRNLLNILGSLEPEAVNSNITTIDKLYETIEIIEKKPKLLERFMEESNKDAIKSEIKAIKKIMDAKSNSKIFVLCKEYITGRRKNFTNEFRLNLKDFYSCISM